MKRLITSFVASGLVSCALALGASTSLLAQSHAVAKAEIPFAFQVGSKVLPAGTYIFSQDSPSIMQLHGTTADAHALSMVRSETGVKAPKVGRITFNKYGDHYFLQSISTSDSTTAYQCPTTKQEKELIRELKANQVAVNVMPNLH